MDRDQLWEALHDLNEAGDTPSRGIVLANGDHALAYFTCHDGESCVLNIACSGGEVGDLTRWSTAWTEGPWDVETVDDWLTDPAEWIDAMGFPVDFAANQQIKE